MPDGLYETDALAWAEQQDASASTWLISISTPGMP